MLGWPTNAPAAQLRAVCMSLLILPLGVVARKGDDMDLFAGMPEWLVWCAAGMAGAIGLAAIANILEATFELDAS
jgi:hypothetical protein